MQKNILHCSNWLLIGLSALLICGLLSVFVVFLRIPYFGNLFSNTKNIFDLSLVIHVNLSIYVWFFSVISFIYTDILVIKSKFSEHNYAITLLILGALMMLISAFIPNSSVIKTNYVPIINNLIFFVSIAFISASILINSILVLKFININFNVCSIAIITIESFLAFLISYLKLNEKLSLEEYYEYLFCGFGHLIQFAFCQMIMIVYLHVNSIKFNKIVNSIFILNVVFAFFGLLIYFIYDNALDISNAFTIHMKIFAGISPILIIFYIFFLKRKVLIFNYGFLLSVLLFLYGGILGFATTHGSVSIPAHYHGSIIALTIGVMAFIYNVLDYSNIKLANCQMTIYAIGQFMHITSLKIMGGYGALRKTTSMALSDSLVQISFVFGGIIAMIGGAMFILLMFSFYKNKILV